MTALDTLAAPYPALIAAHLPAILAAADRGSVIATPARRARLEKVLRRLARI